MPRLALLVLIASGALWPALAHAANCPSTYTVTSGGTLIIDLSGTGTGCSPFGIEGIATQPTHGTLSNDGNGSTEITYKNDGNAGETSDSFTFIDDNDDNQTVTITIGTPTYPPITFTPTTIPAGSLGVAYSQTLTASGGDGGPYTYIPTAGNLPVGVTDNGSATTPSATVTISGTPTESGPFSFTMTATDSHGNSNNQQYTLNINGGTLTISPATAPTANLYAPYSFTMSTSGGTAPYTYTYAGGTLPAGITFNPTSGTISGTPSAVGSGTEQIQVTDAHGVGEQVDYTVTVDPPNITLAPTSLSDATQDTAYSQQLTASGGKPSGSYTYAVNGTLPAGLTLSNSGLLSGTPTGTGTTNFSITATDSSSSPGPYTGTQTYSLKVDPNLPIITTASLPNGTVATAYNQTIVGSKGITPYTFSVPVANLPTGLSLSPAGVLAGTPTASGSFSFTVTLTDSASNTATQNYTVAMAKPTVTFTPTTLPAATLHSPYSQTLTAQGGISPYTYSVSAGSLPTGLSLSSSGVLSGMPSSNGSYSFSITATDSTGGTGPATATNPYTVSVSSPTIVQSPATLPVAQVGVNFNQTISASGGTTPYTYAVTAGTLPAGIILSSSGALSGTPTAGGTFSVTVTATDANTNTGSTTYTWTVNTPTIGISPAAGNLNASYGAAYSQTFSASGGTAPYSYVLSGTLPNGLSWNAATATLSGTATQSGTFPITLTATDHSTGTGPYSGSFNYNLVVSAATITITPSTLPAAAAGTAYTTTQLSASGGIGPYTYSVSSGALPAGLILSSSGALSGTPTATGTFNITVQATDAHGASGTVVYSIAVGAPALTLTPSSLPAANAETAYSQTITAAGGTAPYVYSISSGSLPTGITLNPVTGVISGTPTATGTYSFTVRAGDSSTGTGAPFSVTHAYSVTVSAPSVAITPATLPSEQVATPVSQQFSASGGNGSYTYSHTGTLPTGLSLSNSGLLSGTPTAAGSFSFTVTATDGLGFTGSQAYTEAVIAPTLVLNPTTIPAATAETAYSQTLTASGGTAPYTYAVSAGALPAGLSLDAATGVLSGTPTVSGNSFNFSVRVTDSSTGIGAPFFVDRAYTLKVNAPSIAIAPTTLPNEQVATTVSQQFNASGGNGSYTYSYTGTLPTGLSLSNSGLLSGIPTSAGSFNLTVTATDGLGFTGSQAYTETVNAPAVTLNPATIPAATAETTYSQTLTASGGTAPYTYAVSAGAMPAGLSLNAATGVLSGTPTVSGSFAFSVRVTDSSTGTGAPFFATRSYTLSVAAPGITITPTTLPGEQAAAAYTQQLTASGGNGSYTFTISSGVLPTGLSLSASGLISGTPTTAGNFSFTVTAKDGLSFTGSQAYTVGVQQPKPVVATDSASTAANQPITVAVTSVDTGPITSIAIVKQPTHGSATVSGLNIVYTPANDFFGTDTLTYTATGPGGTSTAATVNLTVTALAVPTATAQNATVLAGNTVSINAVAGASGGPFTAVTVVKPPTSGTATVSGNNIVYAAASDASGKLSFTYTLTNAFGVSAPATVSITVDPRPVANAQSVSAVAGTTVQVNLTQGAQGGPFTAATLVSVSPASAGSGKIEQVSGGYQLSFTGAPRFSGTVTVLFTLSNAYATSTPGTVTIAVAARPDPSKDADVLGVLGAQTDATRRFAQGQIDNFQQRLEALHGGGGGDGGFQNGLTFNADNTTNALATQWPSNLSQNAPGDLNRRYLVQPQNMANPGPTTTMLPNGYSVWTGGAVNFGSRNTSASASGFDFSTGGISLGADKRISSSFAVGVGLGYGHDDTDVGHDGSNSTADSYNIAAYASFSPSESTFIDGLIGYQWLSFDARRYVSADNTMVSGSRDGSQVFASISAGYDYRTNQLLISPYGRLDVAHARLDGYTESGDALYALSYQNQTVQTTTTSLGVHADYAFKEDYGTVSPQVRVEYQHDFQGSSQATMSYADLLAGPVYSAAVDPLAHNHFLIGIGANWQFNSGLTVRFEYDNEIDTGDQNNQSILLSVQKKF